MTTITDSTAYSLLARLFAQRQVNTPPELRQWLREHQRQRHVTRVTFDLQRAHGYVHLQIDDEAPELRPHPKLAGLDDAYRVFLAGATAQNVLHAKDFRTTPNSLRNRLEAAASWADRARCAPLAVCIRSIGVRNGGPISYTQPVWIDLALTIDPCRRILCVCGCGEGQVSHDHVDFNSEYHMAHLQHLLEEQSAAQQRLPEYCAQLDATSSTASGVASLRGERR